MEPNEQPIMQRQLDRSLEINNESQSGFVMKHPEKFVYFLCFVR